MSRFLDSDRSEKDALTFFRDLVRAAPGVFGGDSVRVCVYRLDDADSTDTDAGERSDENKYLTRADYHGRLDVPREEFRGDTRHGAALLKVARGNDPVCVPDYRMDDPPIYFERGEGARWQSFMVLPLRDGQEPAGLLMVDFDHVSDFGNREMDFGLALARIVGLGVSEVARGGTDPKPEVRAISELQGLFQQMSRGE